MGGACVFQWISTLYERPTQQLNWVKSSNVLKQVTRKQSRRIKFPRKMLQKKNCRNSKTSVVFRGEGPFKQNYFQRLHLVFSTDVTICRPKPPQLCGKHWRTSPKLGGYLRLHEVLSTTSVKLSPADGRYRPWRLSCCQATHIWSRFPFVGQKTLWDQG